MTFVSTTHLRATFAASLSNLYGDEVPAYRTLVEECHEINTEVARHDTQAAEHLGSIDRVTAERHGAIRVGSPGELREIAQVFAALGMEPTGFYDLRDAAPAPIPVISTAFRPVERDELARNPFRVFTSMLVPEDRRFFDAELESRLKRFIDARQIVSPELISLAERAEADHGLSVENATRFIELATAAFALSTEPIDQSWYQELESISSVAADIGGVPSLHINHLTPRVLDIDELYRRMEARGIVMIDRIQGPPRWDGPDVLLRQTSFRALAEPRMMREPSGNVIRGELRVRFGEVEARGIALTPAGRDLYDTLTTEVDDLAAQNPETTREALARDLWAQQWPRSEKEMCLDGLGYFTYTARHQALGEGSIPTTLHGLIADGWLDPSPIVYEDFLPRSAAGIFASNLVGEGAIDQGGDATYRSAAWMSDVLERKVHDPYDLYLTESASSLTKAVDELGIDLDVANAQA